MTLAFELNRGLHATMYNMKMPQVYFSNPSMNEGIDQKVLFLLVIPDTVPLGRKEQSKQRKTRDKNSYGFPVDPACDYNE